jgi:hypothetical protein
LLMNRFTSRQLGVLLAAATVAFAPRYARAADPAPAPKINPTPKTTAANAPDLTREFALVPAGDALYSALDAVRRTGWTGLSPGSPTPAASAGGVLTRYEMALETAKAIVTVRARARADARWASTLIARSPEATRGLRTLCIALAPELSRFDAGAPAMAAQLAAWLQAPTVEDFSIAPRATGTDTVAERFAMIGEGARSSVAPGVARSHPTAMLDMPLSQRLRVYAAVSSMARAQSDPFQHDLGTQTSAGITFRLKPWLRARAGVSKSARRENFFRPSPGAGDALATPAPGFSEPGFSEQSLGGGLDVVVRPNLLLSGEIARVQSQRVGADNWLASPAGVAFDGTKIEGGLSLSGWQNRVALSAHLSRLVPEDSLALATTAAQLNLGIGLSQQVSLNLLYRQLFETPQTPRGNRVFGGGFNINF